MACGFTFGTLPRGVRLLVHGDYAVNVFMILSGFVIFKLIEDARESYGVFLARRFFRLYPVYLVLFNNRCSIPPAGLWDNIQHWPGRPLTMLSIRNVNNDRSHIGWHFLAHLTLLHGAVPDPLLRGSAVPCSGLHGVFRWSGSFTSSPRSWPGSCGRAVRQAYSGRDFSSSFAHGS